MNPSDDHIEASALWFVSIDSIYTLDRPGRTITRITGIYAPTPRQGSDGTARQYEDLFVDDPLLGMSPVEKPLPGHELIVSWGDDGLYTRLSTVIAVSDRPAWGRSFTLAEPTDDDGGTGTVVVAGIPTLASRTLSGALVTAAILTIGAADTPTATALGIASAGDPHGPASWDAMDGDPELARPRPDGWRRPWDVPPSFAL